MTMGQHGRAARQLTDDERAALLEAGAQSAADVSELPESADSCSESVGALSDAQGHESRAFELRQQGDVSAGRSNEGSIIDDLADESTASLRQRIASLRVMRQRIASLRVMLDAFVALNPNDWPRVSPSMLRQLCDETEAQLDAQDDRRADETSPALLAELARLGDEYGPLGVALAAAQLTDVRALTSRLNDRLPFDVWRAQLGIPERDVETVARAMYDSAHDLICHQQFTLDLVTSSHFWRELATAALARLAQSTT